MQNISINVVPEPDAHLDVERERSINRHLGGIMRLFGIDDPDQSSFVLLHALDLTAQTICGKHRKRFTEGTCYFRLPDLANWVSRNIEEIQDNMNTVYANRDVDREFALERHLDEIVRLFGIDDPDQAAYVLLHSINSIVLSECREHGQRPIEHYCCWPSLSDLANGFFTCVKVISELTAA